MEYEKKQDPSLYPSAPAPSGQYPPPYTSVQSPPAQPYPQSQPWAPYPQGDPGFPPAGSYGAPQGQYVYPGPQQQQQQPPMVVTAATGYPVIVVQSSMVSMIGAIVLSCFVFWCCGMLFGLIAFILAMIGQSSSSSGNTASAIQLRNASYALSIVGIVLGIVVIVLMFTVGRHH